VLSFVVVVDIGKRYEFSSASMASVHKDGRWNRYWYAHFRDALGRRRKKSTGQTSRSKALEIAHGLQRAANEARRGVLTEARTRELLSEILQSVTGDELRMFTVEQWLQHFVAQKTKSRTVNTAERHRQVTREFLEFLGPRACLNIAAITSKDLASFRDKRQSLGLAPATVNLDIRVLSSAFNAALRQGHITVNPCLVIEPIKEKAQRKGTFTPEQVTALLAAAEGEWRGVILTGFYSGQRLGDVVGLRWRNVDLVSEIKTIRFEQRKTGREIVTVIHPALEDYLLSLPTPENDDCFLFPALAGRITSALSREFRSLMERAHIEQRVIRKGNGSGREVLALSFHSLRHSFSSLLAAHGVAQELRMELTGHTSARTHRVYTHTQLEALRAAVSTLPRV
jgi:integrase